MTVPRSSDVVTTLPPISVTLNDPYGADAIRRIRPRRGSTIVIRLA